MTFVDGNLCSRRETRRQARREAILDVARQSFLEKGYADTSMSAIAAVTGGSKSTLWSHFASKEVLFAAMLDRATDDFQRHAKRTLAPTGRVEDGLSGFGRELLTRLTWPDSIAIYRLVIGESGRFPEIGSLFYDRVTIATRELLAGYLAVAMARGELAQRDAMKAAAEFINLCMAHRHMDLLLGVIDRATPASIAADVRDAVATFLRGNRG